MKKRSRNNVRNTYNLKHFYDDYKSTVEEGSPYDVSRETFYALCEEYFKYIADLLMEQSAVVQLPYRLGHMVIDKSKAKDLNKLPVDWKTSKEIGKKVYHLNPHTDGFKYKFTWSKQRCIVRNRGLYRFKACRENVRHLAAIIKSRQHDFIERGIILKN